MPLEQYSSETFSERCYQLLKKIPKGKVTTYAEIARALNTKAYQAVGNAMGANPNPIIVPCHRVVKSNGQVGGYALGIAKKIELLSSEGVDIQDGTTINLESFFYSFT